VDDVDLESDDDKDYTVSAAAAAEESNSHFSSASVAEMMEFGSLTSHAAVSQSSQLPRVVCQKVDTASASTSWQAAKVVCGDLTSVPSAGAHDEEHNIGK